MSDQEISMFKNKLQQYTQRRRLPLPAYRAANEGSPHAPKFRASVYVDGVEYTSKSTFHRLRNAEQDVAKLAYECILSNSQQSGLNFKPMLPNETKSDKSILNEFVLKKYGDMPEYRTTLGEGEGIAPVYVSQVTVSDKTFTGAEARNKRDAEQLAARAALDSLQGTDSTDLLNQVTSPKRKHFSTPGKVIRSEINQKKIKNVASEAAGNASHVKQMVITPTPRPSTPVIRPVRTSAPRLSTPLTRPVGSLPPRSTTTMTRPIGTSPPRPLTPMIRPVGPSALRPSTPLTRPVRSSAPHSTTTMTRPNVPRVRYGMGNVTRGSNLQLNKKANLESLPPHVPTYLRAAVGPPTSSCRRNFCTVCGFTANYTCVRCGVRFCCIRCQNIHNDTRCLKFVA